MVFAHFRSPVPPLELARRVVRETIDDNCLGLAAELAYYFLLALFPALIFMVALLGALPLQGVLDGWLASLSPFVPEAVVTLLRDQLEEVRQGNRAGLLTLSAAGAVWSSSTAMTAIISTLNRAYDIQETRPWYRTRAIAIVLTVALVTLLILAQGLILIEPTVMAFLFGWIPGDLTGVWQALQWGLAIALIVTALDLVYHFAPDARSEFTWLTPGVVVAAALWIAASMGFRLYIRHVDDFTATYGALAGLIVVMLWFYLSGLAILVGAEVNAEIDHASEYQREVNPPSPAEKPQIGVAAERAHEGSPGG
jgi:membrane protein